MDRFQMAYRTWTSLGSGWTVAVMMDTIRFPTPAPAFDRVRWLHEGTDDDQIFIRHPASSHRLRSLGAERTA
jgi:hypothetical protein